MGSERIKVVFRFVSVMVLTVLLSWLSSSFFEGRREDAVPAVRVPAFSPSTSMAEFASASGMNREQLSYVFGREAFEGSMKISDSSVPMDEVRKRSLRVAALAAESASKNWSKIALKFFLWAVFIFFSWRSVSGGTQTPRSRMTLYAMAVLIFGVALGSDPGPMGTVKDAIVMYGTDGAVFIPRLVAMAVFLSSIVIFNKSICAWGCQAGTLQDLVFRLNRNLRDTGGSIRQYKIPFRVSNAVRVAFFAAIVVSAFVFGVDIVEPVDPFKIFKPSRVALWGGVFLAALFAASLFVYRPWCHLFCPFGLAGWLLERFSLRRVSVDRERCVDCGACARACPSDAMEGILREKKVRPDCFSCGVCLGVCPEKAISFRGARWPISPKNS